MDPKDRDSFSTKINHKYASFVEVTLNEKQKKNTAYPKILNVLHDQIFSSHRQVPIKVHK